MIKNETICFEEGGISFKVSILYCNQALKGDSSFYIIRVIEPKIYDTKITNLFKTFKIEGSFNTYLIVTDWIKYCYHNYSQIEKYENQIKSFENKIEEKYQNKINPLYQKRIDVRDKYKYTNPAKYKVKIESLHKQIKDLRSKCGKVVWKYSNRYFKNERLKKNIK